MGYDASRSFSTEDTTLTTSHNTPTNMFMTVIEANKMKDIILGQRPQKQQQRKMHRMKFKSLDQFRFWVSTLYLSNLIYGRGFGPVMAFKTHL